MSRVQSVDGQVNVERGLNVGDCGLTGLLGVGQQRHRRWATVSSKWF